MPLYEYQCDACGRRFEVIQKFSDPPVDACRECGKGPVHRLPSSPAIQFKGSGWYITDYSRKGKSDSSSTPSAEKTGDNAKTETTSDSAGAKSDSAGAKSDTAKTKSDTAKTQTGSTTASKSKDS
ncbi:MAG TPA: zinc ribbon domain-containing protein [Vicinamibacterales bacterium]